MDDIFPILSGLIPLAGLAFLGWLLLRRLTRQGTEDRGVDPAVAIRRLFLYGLLYLTLLVGAQGLIELVQELLASANERSNQALAQALAFLIVGLPAAAILARYVDRRLSSQPEERSSLAWTMYLNAAILTTLIGTMIATHALLRGGLAPQVDRRFEIDQLAAGCIWAGLWAGHWFYFRRQHGITGDLHLAIGALVGLLPMSIGFGGVLYVVADELYDSATGDPITQRAVPSFGAWAATALVGAATWGWYWLANYRKADRTELWHALVVPIGSLAGFVATVAATATFGYTIVVWFLGDPRSDEAVRHFDSIPALAAIAIVGLTAWFYHRSLLGPDIDRNVAVRAYDYLLSMAALVVAVIGAAMLLVALFDLGRSAVANTIIGGLTLLAVGGPLWAWFWSTIGRHVRANRQAELRSPLRRLYLFSLFGFGGLSALIAVLAVLTGGFEDLLDGTVSQQTLHDNRVGLAVLLTVTGVAWYHFAVYRAERAEQAPPPPRPKLRQIIVVSGDNRDLADDLAEASGASVVHWHRTDTTETPRIDVDLLGDRLESRPDDDLLVLLGEGEPIVVPVMREASV